MANCGEPADRGSVTRVRAWAHAPSWKIWARTQLPNQIDVVVAARDAMNSIVNGNDGDGLLERLRTMNPAKSAKCP
jgi:hypothetical protein